MKHRMGSDYHPNRGMSIELLLAILSDAEDRITSAPSREERHRWIVFHSFVVVTYVVSLRGPEGFLLDLDGLNRHKSRGGQRYLVIALLGQIKGEHQDRSHLIPCIPVTRSGINVRRSLDRLLRTQEKLGFTKGPAIAGRDGRVLSAQCINCALHEILRELFEVDPDLFPADITSEDQIEENYQVFRSLRRTSDTRAIEMGVNSTDIDIINRWALVERAKGKKFSGPMRQYYAQLEVLIEPFLRYTGAM